MPLTARNALEDFDNAAYGPADARRQRSISITMRTPGEDDELPPDSCSPKGSSAIEAISKRSAPAAPAAEPLNLHQCRAGDLRPEIVVISSVGGTYRPPVPLRKS